MKPRRQKMRQADLGDLSRWVIRDLCRFYRLDDFIRVEDETEGVWVFSIETKARRYTISAREARDGDRGRLSCVAEGSDGQRRELASGPFWDLTWEAILRDIISLELVPTRDVEPVDRPPAQVPFATPEMVAALGTIPMIGGGKDDEEDNEEDPIEP